MNDDLIKAVQRVRAGLKEAEVKGAYFGPEDIENAMRQLTAGKYGRLDFEKVTALNPRNLARSAVQGATMNFGDEMVGMVAGDKARDEMRARDEMFREEHPVADFAAGMAGGMAIPGGVAAGAARRGAGIGARVLAGVGAGAASSGVSALGAGEGNLAERADGAVVPAAIGAAAGGVVPGASSVIRIALDPAARAARRLQAAIEAAGGLDAVRYSLDRFRATGRGGQAMLGDLSPRLRMEADFASNNSDDVFTSLGERLEQRSAGAPERLFEDAAEGIGSRPEAGALAEDAVTGTRAWARGPNGFQGLRDANPQIENTEALGRLAPTLEQPYVREAFERARKDGLVGDFPDLGKPSFQHLQDLKEALDGKASEAFKAGNGNLGTKLAEARDEVVGAMRAAVPGYEGVAQEYAVRKARERAIELGSEWFGRSDSRGLAGVVAEMSRDPRTLENFRMGMASKLLDQLDNAKTNRDMAKSIMDNSAAMQRKMTLVFGGENEFERFMSRVSAERDLARMKMATGGSPTARRLQSAEFDPVETGSEVVRSVQNPSGILDRLYSKTLKGRLARGTARTLGPQLMMQGDALGAFLANPQIRRGGLPSTIEAGRIPAALGSLFGNLNQ